MVSYTRPLLSTPVVAILTQMLLELSWNTAIISNIFPPFPSVICSNLFFYTDPKIIFQKCKFDHVKLLSKASHYVQCGPTHCVTYICSVIVTLLFSCPALLLLPLPSTSATVLCSRDPRSCCASSQGAGCSQSTHFASMDLSSFSLPSHHSCIFHDSYQAPSLNGTNFPFSVAL